MDAWAASAIHGFFFVIIIELYRMIDMSGRFPLPRGEGESLFLPCRPLDPASPLRGAVVDVQWISTPSNGRTWVSCAPAGIDREGGVKAFT